MIILRDYFYIKSTSHKEGDEMRLIQACYHGTSIIIIDDIICFGEVGCMTKNMTGDKLGGLVVTWCYRKLFYILLYYILLFYILLYYILLFYILLFYILLPPCKVSNPTLGGLALSKGFAELQPFVALFFRDYFCNYSIF